MIVAIERFVFNYLYKYDSISIDIERIIDIGEDDLRSHLAKLSDTIEKEFDRILPVFEQDHEVILVEIDRNLVKIHGKVIITFKSILAVYPLTEMGRQLLSGKLNDDFKISAPKFAQVIEKIKIERSLKNRQNAAKRIFSVFEIKELPNPYFVKEVKQILSSFLSKDNSVKKSFLYHLITYDKTPSFLPPGNAEFFAKVGLIALNSIGKDEDVFKNGPFYKACLKYKEILNTNTPSIGLKKYFELPDEELKSSHKKIVELISENHKGLEIFKIAYFFLAMKSYLLKHDNNLVLIYNNIIEELEQDKTTALHVLYLIGYTFSFEQLYEGLHTLDRAPLLERKFPKPKAKEEASEEIKVNVNELVKEESEEISEEIEVNVNELVKEESEEISEEIEVNVNELVKEESEEIKVNVNELVKEESEEIKEVLKEEAKEDKKDEANKEELADFNSQTISEEKSKEIELENNSPIKIIQNEPIIEKQNTLNEPEILYEVDSSNQMFEHKNNFDELKQFVLKKTPTSKLEEWELLFESFKIENTAIESFDDFHSKLQFYSKYDKLKPSKKLLEEIENYFQRK